MHQITFELRRPRFTYFTEHDAEGEDVHSLIVDLPCERSSRVS